MSTPSIPRTLAEEQDARGRALQLLVVEGEVISAVDLPERGSLVAGRAPDANIHLSDPSTSGRHAQFHVEAGVVTVEDLGSRNGTQVRGQRIPVGQRQELAPGEAALLGAALVLVQERRRDARRRRLWSHGYFEARLLEECELAQGGGPPFSIARFDVAGDLTRDALVGALGSLRLSDIVGLYGPRAYEILLPRSAPEAAARLVEGVARALEAQAVQVRFALAHYPADGRTPDALIQKACGLVRPRATSGAAARVVVTDEKMREVHRLAQKAAAGNINVLILGETGVGKEVLADSVHRESKRAAGPFLCLNCAALTENLLESEIFGHERGAFTDAKAAKPGLLESASGGTVFLDEIGEMSPSLQAKLLRVIETKQVTRVGGLKPIPIDVRFVSATHRDLVQEIREKRFRSDLYYRLNGLRLEIPPLRERPGEIRPLAETFLEQLAHEAGLSSPPRLTDEAVELLEAHTWPGNVRELRNVVERALLLSDGANIEPAHLPLELLDDASPLEPQSLGEADAGASSSDDRWNAREKAERARIVEALRAEGGNQTRAAKRLGISRGTLMVRLEQFEIARPQKR